MMCMDYVFRPLRHGRLGGECALIEDADGRTRVPLGVSLQSKLWSTYYEPHVVCRLQTKVNGHVFFSLIN